jgi:hypothetical protein
VKANAAGGLSYDVSFATVFNKAVENARESACSECGPS